MLPFKIRSSTPFLLRPDGLLRQLPKLGPPPSTCTDQEQEHHAQSRKAVNCDIASLTGKTVSYFFILLLCYFLRQQ
jgi:hypothetical protein